MLSLSCAGAMGGGERGEGRVGRELEEGRSELVWEGLGKGEWLGRDGRKERKGKHYRVSKGTRDRRGKGVMD